MKIYKTTNKFKLLGRKETAFTKALAYILMNDKDAFEIFLKILQLDIPINHKDISVETEIKGKGGRTDIEIKYGNELYIIIEAKIGPNTIKDQHRSYLPRFTDNHSRNNVMCFLTSYPDTYIHIDSNEFMFKCITWYDIIDAFEDLKDNKSIDTKEFLEYIDSDFVKVHQKEVLIQDMGNAEEIRRLEEHRVYRTGVTRGVPSHFAPYFTRGGGVQKIFEIKHIITITPKGIIENIHLQDEYDEWREGLKLVNFDSEDTFFTYYLLSEPKQLKSPILKRFCDFIPNQIPRNFCVPKEKIK